MASTAIVGATGLVGSQILSTLLSLPSITSIHTLSRRVPASTTSPKLHAHTSAETSTWASTLSSISPPPSIFFSGLGTSRAAAGGFPAQYKLDYGLNLELAKAAREAGVKVYVLISTYGANAQSMVPYTKMKGELEESVKALGFDTTVILRPGLLVGDRKESRPAEWALRQVAGVLGKLGHGTTDFWAQDVEVVGRAAVAAGLEALENGKPKVWEMDMAEIVKLGRTQWKA